MTAGDVTITMSNLAAGASLHVQVTTRCKCVAAIGHSETAGSAAISADGVTFYKFLTVAWLSLAQSGASSFSDKYIYLPAGYYIAVINTDTVAHDAGVICIEY